LQIFEGRCLDKNAQLDGNAVLVDRNSDSKFGKVVDHDILQLSPYRNIHRLEFILNNGRRLHICNTHLHHPIPDDHIRLHQIEGAIAWINKKLKSSDDIVILVGDFNAEPHSLTYKEIIRSGFRSSHLEINRCEPKKTFPTGLQAPYMDTDPALVCDFIFYRVGKGEYESTDKHIKVVNSMRMGDQPDKNDPTIYGSDHFSIVSQFVILPLQQNS
jgi:endonuclease/exonuclease/phosphatase family metal-dependent hydrolase